MRAAIVGTVLLALSPWTSSWNGAGHRLTGIIAYEQMS